MSEIEVRYPKWTHSIDKSRLPTLKSLEELLEITKESKNPSCEILSLKESTNLINTTEDTKDIKVNRKKSESDKDKLIGQYLQLLGEKQKLFEQNLSLQIKVLDQLKENKKESITEDDDNSSILALKVNYNKDVEEMKQKFAEELSAFVTSKQMAQHQNENIHKILSQKTEECQSQRRRVQEKKRKLWELKSNIASKFDGKLRGEMEKVLENEDKKEEEIETLRLQNSQLQMQIEKLRAVLRQKKKIAGSLNTLDFEQLKFENQANNERLEERNEEVLKLKNKISSSLQVLTHAKEKLHFFQRKLAVEQENLDDTEKTLSQMRDVLSHMKRVRDSIKDDNRKLKASAGLIDNEFLLRDFEDCSDNCDGMRNTLEQLKHDYHMLKTKSRLLHVKFKN